mmetsp:Transcript_174542/g.554000  ORF Transcript_174542/g.554000 Transcript_174542/m.554000 type:complete len:218 (+) Transcript_174542:188-841(+)
MHSDARSNGVKSPKLLGHTPKIGRLLQTSLLQDKSTKNNSFCTLRFKSSKRFVCCTRHQAECCASQACNEHIDAGLMTKHLRSSVLTMHRTPHAQGRSLRKTPDLSGGRTKNRTHSHPPPIRALADIERSTEAPVILPCRCRHNRLRRNWHLWLHRPLKHRRCRRGRTLLGRSGHETPQSPAGNHKLLDRASEGNAGSRHCDRLGIQDRDGGTTLTH